MANYFYTVTYSFDSDRHAVGPFQTWDEAWVAMLKNAENEKRKRTDRKICGLSSTMLDSNEKVGKITLTDFFFDHEAVTTWLLFDSMET